MQRSKPNYYLGAPTELDNSNSNQFRVNAFEKDLGQITNNPHFIARRFFIEINKRIVDVEIINSILGH